MFAFPHFKYARNASVFLQIFSKFASCVYIPKHETFLTGTSDGKSIAKVFMRKNKTAPLPVKQSIIEYENLSPNEEVLHSPEAGEKSTQTMTTILDPLNLEIDHRDSYPHMKLIRPYTAPERSQRLPNKMTIINIPGQVPQ